MRNGRMTESTMKPATVSIVRSLGHLTRTVVRDKEGRIRRFISNWESLSMEFIAISRTVRPGGGRFRPDLWLKAAVGERVRCQMTEGPGQVSRLGLNNTGQYTNGVFG